MIDIEIYIIKSLPNEYIEKTINSIKLNRKFINASIKIIDELETRETTLNEIMSIRDPSKDLFVVADDIIFIDGWLEALDRNYSNGDIIGFSMLDSKSGKLQDYGYDFILSDHGLSYRGMYKHSDPNNVDMEEYRECDSVTGCAIVIKKDVCNKVKNFPLEGANRWGELIFCHLAKKEGFKTIVLGAHLKHGAISTKQKKSATKSSLSWLIERDQWAHAVDSFLYDAKPKASFQSDLSDDLVLFLNQSKSILMYGCGINADALLSNISHQNWQIASGLKEEVNAKFRGKTILDISKIDFDNFDDILITPVGYDEDILRHFPTAIIKKIKGVSLTHINDKILLSLRKLDSNQS